MEISLGDGVYKDQEIRIRKRESGYQGMHNEIDETPDGSLLLWSGNA